VQSYFFYWVSIFIAWNLKQQHRLVCSSLRSKEQLKQRRYVVSMATIIRLIASNSTKNGCFLIDFCIGDRMTE